MPIQARIGTLGRCAKGEVLRDQTLLLLRRVGVAACAPAIGVLKIELQIAVEHVVPGVSKPAGHGEIRLARGLSIQVYAGCVEVPLVYVLSI